MKANELASTTEEYCMLRAIELIMLTGESINPIHRADLLRRAVNHLIASRVAGGTWMRANV